MSLYDLMICDRVFGGCGHARHRHTRAAGSPVQNARKGVGACRTEGSDGRCSCLKFRERTEVTKECRTP